VSLLRYVEIGPDRLPHPVELLLERLLVVSFALVTVLKQSTVVVF